MKMQRESSISDNRFIPIKEMNIIASSSVGYFPQTTPEINSLKRRTKDTPKYYSDDITGTGWTPLEMKTLTPHDLDHYRTKSKLTDLIQKFKRVPFFHDSDQCANKGAADNALKLLCQMDEKLLPKVAVDEDGEIIFAWNVEERNIVLTFEENLWHFFEKEGSNPPNYYDEESYVNGEIPNFVWEKIPTK